MTERVLLPLRQRHTQHQRDADGQRNGYFKGADAVGKGQRIVALYKIVGAVVDASAGHQRKMPDSRNTVTGILITMANTRVSRVRGITASREAAALSAPSITASS